MTPAPFVAHMMAHGVYLDQGVEKGRLFEDLSLVRHQWEAQQLTDAAYTTVFFLLWQINQHGARFASRMHRHQSKPEPKTARETLLQSGAPRSDEALAEYLNQVRLFKIPPSIPKALQGWLVGHWPLHLLTRIPSPKEVLSMQTQGLRPVTVIHDFPRALRPILTKRNAFDFLCHDLEHAAKFCSDRTQFQTQVAFFRRLEVLMDAPFFKRLLGDPVFHEKMDYLISDMNTHPIHGLCYLHAILIERVLLEEGKTTQERLSEVGRAKLSTLMVKIASLWEFDDQGTQALLNLASGRFEAADADVLEIILSALPGPGERSPS